MVRLHCPNSNLISQELVNWTLSNQIRRIEVQVGAAYGSNPETVLRILTTVARKHPGVLEKPEPVALFRGFGDSSLNFALRCFSSFDDWLALAANWESGSTRRSEKPGLRSRSPSGTYESRANLQRPELGRKPGAGGEDQSPSPSKGPALDVPPKMAGNESQKPASCF